MTGSHLQACCTAGRGLGTEKTGRSLPANATGGTKGTRLSHLPASWSQSTVHAPRALLNLTKVTWSKVRHLKIIVSTIGTLTDAPDPQRA